MTDRLDDQAEHQLRRFVGVVRAGVQMVRATDKPGQVEVLVRVGKDGRISCSSSVTSTVREFPLAGLDSGG